MDSMTDNPEAVVDEDTFSVRRTIRIAAPVEKVWSAVTEPAHISRWFGQVVLDPAGSGTISWPDRGGIPLQVLELDPPRSVSYRWCNDDASGVIPERMDEQHSTVFTFTLEPVADGTRLTVLETGFGQTSDPALNMTYHRSGWTGELDKLVALLENGS